MKKVIKIARRSFLIGSASIVGGVAFGVYAYHKPGHNVLKDSLNEGEAALTPYVKITPDGIILTTPHCDKGQGAYSVQAALIAEELDVTLEDIQVDPGVPAPVYYNTAISQETVPFASTDNSLIANSVRTTMDAAMKFTGMQITGGSTTVADSYTKLRVAGAVARETLKQAASLQSNIAVEKLRTEKGHVILPNGDQISYLDLARTAANIDPVEEVILKAEDQWRLIGKPMQRIDIEDKSTGKIRYGIDLKLDNMLIATVKQSPTKNGGIKSIELNKADQMPGVEKVVRINNAIAVIAQTTWQAFNAIDEIEIEGNKPDYPLHSDEHWQILENSFQEEKLAFIARDEGDANGENLLNSNKIEREYRAPYVAHAPLEPLNATIKVSEKRVDVWTGTQTPQFLKSQIAKITQMDEDNIHIHAMMMGGSFGHRLETLVMTQAAEIAMAMPGTPIKLIYKREEDFAQDFTRQIAMAKATGHIKGKEIIGLDLGIAMPSVRQSQTSRLGLPDVGKDMQMVAGAWDQPYTIENYKVAAYKAGPLPPVSSWRSVGASSNAFFHDSFLDELIHAADLDPMEERIRLMWHENSRKTLEAVAQMSDWSSPLAKDKARGVAFCLSFGVPCAQVIEISNTPNGIKIDKVFVAAEVGKIIDPINFDNLVKGGVVWGLGHAMNCEITYSDGMVDQTNYHVHEGMRLYQCPEIFVKGLENGEKVKGIGEPPVPPAAPALANAIFAATGKRIREMPFNKHINFI